MNGDDDLERRIAAHPLLNARVDAVQAGAVPLQTLKPPPGWSSRFGGAEPPGEDLLERRRAAMLRVFSPSPAPAPSAPDHGEKERGMMPWSLGGRKEMKAFFAQKKRQKL
jgi:hypothetical protein